YQLDFEMSFVTQEDVFAAVEPVLQGVFEEFGGGRAVTPAPFPRIAFADAMLRYGSDKPDLRHPLVIADVTQRFPGSRLGIFARQVEQGAVVRAIPAPGAASRPRSFFDKLNDWAKEQGAAGLGYIGFAADGAKGPIAKNLDEARQAQIRQAAGLQDGGAAFFALGKKGAATKVAGGVRKRDGGQAEPHQRNAFRFCWVVEFPMYELNPDTGKIEFSHNPFSMPQGGLE